jgi:hypothetical protein
MFQNMENMDVTDNMTMILSAVTGFGQKMSNKYIIDWLVNPLQSVF